MAQTMLQDLLHSKFIKKENAKSSFFSFSIDKENAKILSVSIPLDEVERSLYR